jgi:hypothetical protein
MDEFFLEGEGMVPSREIFWNIEFGEILYIIAAIVIGILAYSIYRHYRRWRLGGPANRGKHLGKRVWRFLVTGVLGRLSRLFSNVTFL